MKTEQLSRANEIKEQIKKLEKSKDDVTQLNKSNCVKTLYFYANHASVGLISEMSPIPIDNFIEMYILSIDKKIAELEKEFEKL